MVELVIIGGGPAGLSAAISAAKAGAQVTVVENPHVVDISSTRLRQLLPEGREYLPEAVYGYILRQRLYGTHAELKHLTPEELRSRRLDTTGSSRQKMSSAQPIIQIACAEN